MSVGERIIQEGWDVYTSDEQHVGKVREERTGYIHVHHGRLFGKAEYYFPSWAIGRVDEAAERVYLTLSEGELEGRDWSAPPGGVPEAHTQGDVQLASQGQLGGPTEIGGSTGAAGGLERDREATTRLETTGTAGMTGTAATAGTAGTVGTGGATGTAETLDQREIVVPIVEERLDVSKRQVELGEVIIGREVVEREETVPVEVAHEEVRVERRPVSREASPEDLRLAAGEGLAQLEAGGSVIVPIIEEVVEVRKRLMVREELVITKQRVTERHEVTERLRRMEPQVESTGRIEREVEGRADADATTPVRTTGTAGAATTSATTAAQGDRDDDRDDRGDRNPLQRAADAVRDKVDDIRDR
jgi:uncharacterized protein (TIGR02271 family)